MSKKQLTITMSIIVILAAIGGWDFYSQKQTVNPPVVDDGVEPDGGNVVVENGDIDTSDSSSTALATEDWLTYRNEEYGFEVRYPEGWGDNYNISSYKDGIYQNIFYVDNWGETQKEGAELYDGAYFKISFITNKESISIHDFINMEHKNLNNIENMEVNGKLFYIINVDNINNFSGDSIENSYMKDIYFEMGNNILKMKMYSIGGKYITLKQVLDQIFNTFKFIK